MYCECLTTSRNVSEEVKEKVDKKNISERNEVTSVNERGTCGNDVGRSNI